MLTYAGDLRDTCSASLSSSAMAGESWAVLAHSVEVLSFQLCECPERLLAGRSQSTETPRNELVGIPTTRSLAHPYVQQAPCGYWWDTGPGLQDPASFSELVESCSQPHPQEHHCALKAPRLTSGLNSPAPPHKAPRPQNYAKNKRAHTETAPGSRPAEMQPWARSPHGSGRPCRYF